MGKRSNKRFCGRRGFSLTEMIAVLAIIGILAAAVIGVGRYAMKRARLGKANSTFQKLTLGIELFRQDCGTYVPDSIETNNGESLLSVLDRLSWPSGFTDALGRKRSGLPSSKARKDYDKPSEILFFFLEEMYDVMNFKGNREKNRLLLASLDRTTAYVKFKRNELADTDGDGLPEIVDGWGMPFLYVAADRLGREENIEPHRGKNPGSFSLYSFGPDKLGYYDPTRRGEEKYPVGDLNFDGKSDSDDDSEMTRRIKKFAQQEGYSDEKATLMANKDNLTNWERER